MWWHPRKEIQKNKFNPIMNRNFNATTSAAIYVTPQTEMLDVTVEGVICTSGSIEGWKETVAEW